MKQINVGRSQKLPVALKNSVSTPNRKRGAKSSRFSRSIALAGGIFMLSLQLLSGKANAQIYKDGFEGVVVSGSSANSGGATGDVNLGIAASSWSSTGSFTTFAGTAPTTPTALSLSNSTPTTQTFTLSVPINSCYQATVTGLTFDYRATSTSYANLNITVNGTLVDVVTLTTNSAFHNVSVPAFSVVASPTVTVAFIFSGGTHGSGGTLRVDNVNLLGSVAATGPVCSGIPASGTVLPAATTVCDGTGSDVALTLSGATAACGIVYQWQDSTRGSVFTNISGATNSNFTTPVVSATTTTTDTTYYRCITTCTNSSMSAASSAAILIANPLPVAPAFTVPTPLIVDSTDTLHIAATGGFWSSSNTGAATIGGTTGALTGVSGGTTQISYSVLNPITGCANAATETVNVVWPNTLGLYVGTGGNSTGVIGIPGETVTSLGNNGFGTTTPCTTGGLSGLTVPVADSVFSVTFPHVSYILKPIPGKALVVTSIFARTRESATGPKKARLAYSLNGGLTWTVDSAVTQVTGGSCGSNSNSWFWTLGGPTIAGITDSIVVALYAYDPGASSGTFQVNQLEVEGTVTDTTRCSGVPVAGVTIPSRSSLCDSGSRTLSFTGSFAPGSSYQWQSSTNGVSFTNISGATNVTYTTPELHAITVADTMYYQVVTTCGFSGLTNTSNIDTITVTPIPSGFAITGAPDSIIIGTPVTLGNTYTGTGSIFWGSNDTSVASVDSVLGTLNGNIPGIATISFFVTEAGCTGVTRDTIKVIEPNTISVYLGKGGNSTVVTPVQNVTNTALTSTGYGTVTPCGEGGISGLTNNGVTSYSSTGANSSFTITPASGEFIYVAGFYVTLRSSASGIQNVRLAYSQDGGTTWVDEGADQTVEFDDCGFSHAALYWGGANIAAPVLPFINGPVIFRVYGFNPAGANGTLQINTIDITGKVAPLCQSQGDMTGLILDSTGTNADGQTYCDFNVGRDYLFTNATPGDINFWSSDNAAQLAFDSVGTVSGVSHIYPVTANPFVDITYTGWFNAESVDGCLSTTTALVTIDNCSFARKATVVATVNTTDDVKIYPNPASTMLNIIASEDVNISVLSMDGKTLIDQKNCKSVDVRNLASGMYMIQVYGKDNSLIKTAKFTKE